MAARTRLGLVFTYDEGWIGGTYYLLNLVRSLALLPDSDRPEIVVLATDGSDFERMEATGYPYLTFRSTTERFSLAERVLNSLSFRATRKRIIDKRVRSTEIDLLFPSRFSGVSERMPDSRQIAWIPDLQEHHLPRFFSEQELEMRRKKNLEIAHRAPAIVFSSRSAQADFERWYEAAGSTHVLNFAVHHPEYESIPCEGLYAKHGLEPPYFLVTNQFWAHKNHRLVLEALIELRAKGVRPAVGFTGAEDDYRAPTYFRDLRRSVTRYQLEDQVHFLGFIDRREQLRLMQQAVAVIQPSLFEGWSTVVEDCKAMGQLVLLSDIRVHREQLQQGACFFDPDDSSALAGLMEEVLDERPPGPALDYESNRLAFGRGFLRIVDETLRGAARD